MSSDPSSGVPEELGDFTTTVRVVPLTLLAAVIGMLAAFVARLLLGAIAFFTNLFFFQRFSIQGVTPSTHHLGYAVVLVPIVGGLIIGFMARYGSEKIRGHGIPEAIEAILLRGSRVQARVAVLKPLSSAISIGSGGPFGAEGPIIMTGGAFGSLVAQFFELSAAERKTLLVAGAAAGMSATFDSPLAASLLAVELLLFEWKPRSMIPVMVASVVAASVRPYLLGTGPLFPIAPSVSATPHPTWALVFACAACGIAAGIMSGLLTKGVYFFEDAFLKLPIHWMWWPALGGLAIGIGGLVEPRALGVGYETIESLLRGDLFGRALLVLMIAKSGIWMISLGSGTSGGVLAPLLIMGASLGGLEALVLPNMGPGFWPLVSMAAILGGTMRSPFTGIVFALEVTHAWGLVVPLLLAVPMAHAFTVLALKRSILTEKVSRRGFHLSREYETDPLEILFVREVMSIEEDVIARAAAAFEQAGAKPAVAYANEPLRVAVYRMAETGMTRLPVINGDPRAVVGEITLEDMLKARVRHLEEEQRRERIRHLPPVIPQRLLPRPLRGKGNG